MAKTQVNIWVNRLGEMSLQDTDDFIILKKMICPAGRRGIG